MNQKQVLRRRIIHRAFFGIWIILLLLIYAGSVPVVHQACPYASVCFGSLLFHGLKVYLPIVIIGIAVVLGTLIGGRKFCGYVCFLGTAQEYLYKVNPTRSRIKHRFGRKTDKAFKHIKYLVFIITLILALARLQYHYMGFCPLYKIAHPYNITRIAHIFFILIFILSVWIERFWCRYLCPYAAMMNLFQFLGRITGIKRKNVIRNLDKSINCPNCPDYCPMGIDIKAKDIITDPECIHCLRCVRFCEVGPEGKRNCLYGKQLN